MNAFGRKCYRTDYTPTWWPGKRERRPDAGWWITLLVLIVFAGIVL